MHTMSAVVSLIKKNIWVIKNYLLRFLHNILKYPYIYIYILLYVILYFVLLYYSCAIMLYYIIIAVFNEQR